MNYLGRYRLIIDRQNNKSYLERYYIFLLNRKEFPFNIFIHKFLSSDPDDLHDHPWNYRTLILAGGYWEYTKDDKKWHGPGSYIYSDASRFHRIELDDNIPYCWTLFIPGKQQREWGFKVNDKWIHNKEYLN